MSKKAKVALPKRIGGIKIPKQVRKSKAAAFFTSPKGRLIAAEIATAAGAALIAKSTDPDSRIGKVVRKPLESVKNLGESAGDAGAGLIGGVAGGSAAFTYALAEAARAFSEALQKHEPGEVGDASATAKAGGARSQRPTPAPAGAH